MSGPPPRGDHDTSGAIKDALDAVAANCYGKSRDEIEELLRDELAARRIEIPETLIRSAADVLARPRGVSGPMRMMRLALRTLTSMASAAAAMSDMLSGADPGLGAIKDPADRTSAWVDVVLDDEGRATLRSRRARLGLQASVGDQVAVRLERS